MCYSCLFLISLVSYLNTYNNNQGCCNGNGKSLLIGKVGAVLCHHDGEGSVGNEEKQEWCAHPLQRAQEKLSLVEEEVLLSRFVEARVTNAVLVIDILQKTDKQWALSISNLEGFYIIAREKWGEEISAWCKPKMINEQYTILYIDVG